MLEKAIVFATEKHSGMVRKKTKTPYILHPLEAASIVATMTDEKEIMAATVLHDLVEDTETDISEIREKFGERVAQLVGEESEDKRENLPPEETWKIRKEETIAALRETKDIAVKMICLGDKLSNIRAINRDYSKFGEKLWERFNQKDPEQHFWYYTEIAEALSELSDFPAWKEYNRLVKETFEER